MRERFTCSKSSAVFFQHFPFLLDLNIKHNSKANFFSIQSNLEKNDDNDIQNYAVNHCYCYSLLDSVLRLFPTTRLELNSK